MTFRVPKPSIIDKFLRLLGKSRAVQLPTKIGQHGEHIFAFGIKESFWKALIRPNSEKLPEGAIDIFMMEELKDYKNSMK